MSKYYVNKFLFTVDRDPIFLERYKNDSRNFVAAWEQSIGPKLNEAEESTINGFTNEERQTLIDYDYVRLFEMGAHFFLVLTIFVAIFDEEYTRRDGPLSFQRDYAKKLAHWTGKKYPGVGLWQPKSG